MGGTRCWVGTDGGVAGFDPDGAEPQLVATDRTWGAVAAVGDVLAVLREGELVTFDGITGDLRWRVDAPQAKGLLASDAELWLDETRRTRPVSFGGVVHDPVGLGEAIGLLAVSRRHLATRTLGPFDYGSARVLTRAGDTVLDTPRLANVGSAAFVDGSIVVASDDGVRRWPLDGGESGGDRPEGLARVVPAPAGWVELWNDRHDSSVGTRVVRVGADGRKLDRTFPTTVVEATFGGGHLWLLVPRQPIPPLSPVGPVTAMMVDDALETVASVELGDAPHRGGFAVCVAT